MSSTLEQAMMDTALRFALLSKCKRLQVGCVISTEDFSVINSIGYNGNARGIEQSCDPSKPGNCSCDVHGECNALIKADYSIKNKRMFVSHSPCIKCAAMIINAGIKYVYYHTEYRDTLPLELLKKAKIEVRQI